jgi:hypothetical protein
MENKGLKFLILVMEVMIKKHPQLFCSIMMGILWILELMLYRNMQKLSKMGMKLFSSKM